MLTSEYRLQAMEIKDVPQVMEIEEEAQEYPWTDRIFIDCLKLGYQGYLIREINTNKVVCFSFFSFAADECHLLNIATAREFQRRGLAKELLKYCLDFYKQKQIKYCYLEVRESNIIAQQMYGEFGFKISGIRKDYYQAVDGRESAFVMSLEV
jgi:ribosomal-protein-alanine N-acetyltransferase